MSKSKLMIVFKDSLAGTPEKLRYRVYINSVQIGEGEVGKNRDIASYQITWHENRLVIDEERVIVPKQQPKESVIVPKQPEDKQSYDYVEVKVVAANGSEKTIGRHKHLRPTNTTVTLVSPWVRIPLAGGRMFEGDFFEVEYNIKRKDHNLFAKVIIKDIPRKIVLTALKYRGSKKWEFDTEKTSTRKLKKNDSRHAGLFMGKPTAKEIIVTEEFKYPNPSNKCSTFVYDVLQEVGINIPWLSHGWIPEDSPPLAGEWGDNKLTFLDNDWFLLRNNPLPGDIGSFDVKRDYGKKWSDASGHVGFILTDGVCISAGHYKVEVNDAGFRMKNGTALQNDFDFKTFRRYKHKVIKK